MKQILITLSVLLLASCSKNYEIHKEDNSMEVSRVDVILSEKVNKLELENISNEIREDKNKYKKVWISFYLADFPPESGISPWARGSFTPNLEIEIFGEDKPNIEGRHVDFPMYETVLGMLEEAHDYEEHNLELFTEKPLHIRVSNDYLRGESEQKMIEQTKRDIIYVAFQAFAKTNIDSIIVTSIPIIRKDFNPNLPYDGKMQNNLKQTKTITREQALEILEKYAKTKSFKDLYQLNGTMYLPNDKFSLLRFGQLENVYGELI